MCFPHTSAIGDAGPFAVLLHSFSLFLSIAVAVAVEANTKRYESADAVDNNNNDGGDDDDGNHE